METDDDKDAAAVAKVPSASDAKFDDHEKCNTPSCRAARHENEEKKAEKKPVVVEHHNAKPKMVVIHKAERKLDKKEKKADPKSEVHTIKTRPPVKHTDPTTKAHQKLIEAKLKADSSSQEAANEKAKSTDD